MLTLLALACGPKHATGGPSSAQLAGTTWTMDSSLDDAPIQHYQVVLAGEGLLEVHNERDTTQGNDHWQVQAGVLTLTMNDAYVTYTGRFVSPDRVEGSAQNVRGETWRFALCRGTDCQLEDSP